jgi:transcriptional regulator with XRE-family HTH domain
MADSETEVQYKQAFIERVKAARIATGMKQWQIADALGMPQDKYKQYESRSLLPHHLIGRFCIVTRVDPEWLITGRGQKPPKPPATGRERAGPRRETQAQDR